MDIVDTGEAAGVARLRLLTPGFILQLLDLVKAESRGFRIPTRLSGRKIVLHRGADLSGAGMLPSMINGHTLPLAGQPELLTHINDLRATLGKVANEFHGRSREKAGAITDL